MASDIETYEYKHIFACNCSGGVIKIEISGDGDNKETTINLKDGLFVNAETFSHEDGICIKIIGSFEIAELIEALVKNKELTDSTNEHNWVTLTKSVVTKIQTKIHA